MSDVQIYQPVVTDLVKFAEDASSVHKIATALATTSFVPKSMQGKPDEITGAILAGRELGLPPMTALSTIHVIEGRPTMSANALRGLAMAAGVVFETISASDTRVQMRAKAPGQNAWTEVDWPIERARKMGLTNKSNWTKMPQAMLIARATSELCRLVAANVLLGMPYSTEELQDTGEDAERPQAVMNRTRPRRREPIQATVAPEPPLDDPLHDMLAQEGRDFPPDGQVIGRSEPAQIEAAPESDGMTGFDQELRDAVGEHMEASGETITDRTRSAIMIGFKELGIIGRPDRLARVSAVVGREIASVNQLTEAEGRRVVAKIQEVREGWPQAAESPQ
jgi:hypothetical protein